MAAKPTHARGDAGGVKNPPEKRAAALVPAGWLIAVTVFALVGGRWLQVLAQRPAHRKEILSEFGSVSYLMMRDGPQPDQTGARLAYGQTTEN
jgi:hypothetical protein